MAVGKRHPRVDELARGELGAGFLAGAFEGECWEGRVRGVGGEVYVVEVC